jgi:hypothetical protein
MLLVVVDQHLGIEIEFTSSTPTEVEVVQCESSEFGTLNNRSSTSLGITCDMQHGCFKQQDSTIKPMYTGILI